MPLGGARGLTGALMLFSASYLALLLYLSQHLWAPGGTALGVGLLGMYILLALPAVLAAAPNGDSFTRCLLLFMLINVVAMSTLLIDRTPAQVNMARTVTVLLLSYFPAYWAARRDALPEKAILSLVGGLALIGVLSYFRTKSAQITAEQINDVYAIVFALPALMLVRRHLIKMALMVLAVLVVADSAKRGALVTTGVFLVVEAVRVSHTRRWHIPRAVRSGLAALAAGTLLFGMMSVAQRNELTNARFAQLTESESNNRTTLFEEIGHGWGENVTALSLFVGHGFAGSTKLSGGVYAHNDLIEVFASLGILGLVVYLALWRLLWVTIRKTGSDRPERWALAAGLAVWIVDSQYQQFYNSLHATATMVTIGYCVGRLNSGRKARAN